MFGVLDEVRRAQGAVLEGLGFGPTECSYRIVASGPHWSLRKCLLLVAAPIKRPYIWYCMEPDMKRDMGLDSRQPADGADES
jgi:hypothetical protein